MRQLMWVLIGLAALIWSLFAWALHAIAGSGEAAVMTVTRWLQIEPTSTIWLADILAAIGGPTQVLVFIGWAIGMGALALVALIGTRLANQTNAIARSVAAEREKFYPVVEGQVKSRSVATPVPPEKPFDG